MSSPNYALAALSIVRSLMRVRPPRPAGSGTVDHSGLGPVLDAISAGGAPALADVDVELKGYLTAMSEVEPDGLTRNEALAYWLNLYNAGALALTTEAWRSGVDSVLRVPGAFRTRSLTISGERLSLDGIEHGKVRRFGDPRIHAALVCGSTSCPTLALVPYQGEELSHRLDVQMNRFVAAGAVRLDRVDGVVSLSSLFRWYGADFARPAAMPTVVPAGARRVSTSLAPWLEPEDADWIRRSVPRVEWQSYDWGLRCAVG